MMTAFVLLTLLALLLGLGLGFASRYLKVESTPLVEEINQLLPQTQCGQCEFPGCKPYAEAIAAGSVDINRCPPGGTATIEALAKLLDREVKDLDNHYGIEKPVMLAKIDEARCIGCTLCIQACPVDAILGASKLMHTVIAAECTGCELCLPPCPVDCIDLVSPSIHHGHFPMHTATVRSVTP